MTAQSSIPLKWYVPFANGDAGRVELPVTTADPTRASQTLGFPPLTMQPPESGGVPPQGEDFNGGMNQVARIAWWTLNAGGWPFDSTFATNSNINGYPNGALLQSADFRGYWLNTSDNNQINPDTVGTGWVPGFQYGSTAIAGLTNANVTLSPAQASKDGISLAGALTGNVQIIVPTWLKNWSVTNNTTGAFAITFKTASGSGIIIPQNGAPTTVAGDGTNITQAARNIAAAATGTQAVQLVQVGSGQCRLNVQSTTSLILNSYNGNNVIVNGIPLQLTTSPTVSNAGLSASTLYYVYLSGTTAAPVLELSTTGHTRQASTGIETKTGDVTRSLVGMVRTNASTQFVNSATQRFCLNWFNRVNLSAQFAISSPITFGNTSSALFSGFLVEFLAWGDEGVWAVYDGVCSNSNANAAVQLVSGMDGTSNIGAPNTFNSAAANLNGNFSTSLNNTFAEGYHFTSLFGNVNAGTGTIGTGAQTKVTTIG